MDINRYWVVAGLIICIIGVGLSLSFIAPLHLALCWLGGWLVGWHLSDALRGEQKPLDEHRRV